MEHPDFGHAYESLAEAYLFVGDNAAARAYFGGIVEADPTNPYAHYGLAQVELREGNVDRAIEQLKPNHHLDPQFHFAYANDSGLAQAYDAKTIPMVRSSSFRSASHGMRTTRMTTTGSGPAIATALIGIRLSRRWTKRCASTLSSTGRSPRKP